MISPERLAALHYMAEHNGYNEHLMKRVLKENGRMNENSTMICVSPSEMKELLKHYQPEQS